MSAPKSQTVAVTGSTGFVGREVVRALLAAGHHVRALARDRDKARATLPADARVTTILGDAASPAALTELLRTCDACIHLIGMWDPLESTCRHASLSIL